MGATLYRPLSGPITNLNERSKNMSNYIPSYHLCKKGHKHQTQWHAITCHWCKENMPRLIKIKKVKGELKVEISEDIKHYSRNSNPDEKVKWIPIEEFFNNEREEFEVYLSLK